MDEVFIDLRKYDLSNRLEKDMVSVEWLTRAYEEALDEIEKYKKIIKRMNEEPYNPYDDPMFLAKERMENDWN